MMKQQAVQNLSAFFKSVLEQDNAAVVLCDLHHTIVYMNPVAIRSYEKYGGEALVGKSLLACHNEESNKRIEAVLAWFRQKRENNRVHTFFREGQNKDGYMVALRDDEGTLIGYYEKHEYRDRDLSPFYALD